MTTDTKYIMTERQQRNITEDTTLVSYDPQEEEEEQGIKPGTMSL